MVLRFSHLVLLTFKKKTTDKFGNPEVKICARVVLFKGFSEMFAKLRNTQVEKEEGSLSPLSLAVVFIVFVHCWYYVSLINHLVTVFTKFFENNH